jgi:hypothetical protein
MNPQKKLLAECAKRTPINKPIHDLIGGVGLAIVFLLAAFV